MIENGLLKVVTNGMALEKLYAWLDERGLQRASYDLYDKYPGQYDEYVVYAGKWKTMRLQFGFLRNPFHCD